jgi:hypothetical protein
MAFLSFLVLVPFAVVGAYLNAKFLRHLRESHMEVWRSLGSPSFWNQSIQNGFAVLRFLLKKEFRSLEDPEFIRLCEQFRVFIILYISGFGSWLVLR